MFLTIKYSNKIFLIIWLFLSITACGNNVELNPFTSDGCSLFPDNSIITQQDWCECCFQHDLAYWKGGSEEERKQVDLQLEQCVFEKTQDKALAKLMYEGVRFGGSPYFYNWYRWGYGWSYLDNHRAKYQTLTEAEQQRAKELIEQYFANNQKNYCQGH